MTTKTCIYCGRTVTEAQLKHAEAIKIKRGQYAHTDCIDDTSRPKGDAYRKEPK
mgnify:CR=1 FL=1